MLSTFAFPAAFRHVMWSASLEPISVRQPVRVVSPTHPHDPTHHAKVMLSASGHAPLYYPSLDVSLATSPPMRHIIFRLEDHRPVSTLRSYTLPGTLVSFIVPSSPHPAIPCLDLRYFPCVTLAFPTSHVDVVSARFRFLHCVHRRHRHLAPAVDTCPVRSTLLDFVTVP